MVNYDVHTTKWANAYKDLPDSIIKIVDGIKNLSIEKKIISSILIITRSDFISIGNH